MPIQVHQMDRTRKEILDVTKTLEAQNKERVLTAEGQKG